MKGVIFNIQRYCMHDGPGIRSTVFFKGCNLRCRWCHNPESQNARPEIMRYKDKCTGCGRCVAGNLEENFICYNHALELCGKSMSVTEVFDELIKDKSFYNSSGGGVTFSGGECMLQIDFLAEILKKCKENDLHTAVDTAGNVRFDDFLKIIPYTDLILYDLKCIDAKAHKKFTGVYNHLILENYVNLKEANVKLWVRIPIIPTVNDSIEEMTKFKQFFKTYGAPQKIEFMPYHKIGEHKYDALDRDVERFDVPQKEKLEMLWSTLNE